LPAGLPPTEAVKSFSTVIVFPSGERVAFDVPNSLPFLDDRKCMMIVQTLNRHGFAARLSIEQYRHLSTVEWRLDDHDTTRVAQLVRQPSPTVATSLNSHCYPPGNLRTCLSNPCSKTSLGMSGILQAKRPKEHSGTRNPSSKNSRHKDLH